MSTPRTTTSSPPPSCHHCHHPLPQPRPAQAVLRRNLTSLLSSVPSFVRPPPVICRTLLSFVITRRRGRVVVDRRRSLSSHCPPLMLPSLVDCCCLLTPHSRPRHKDRPAADFLRGRPPQPLVVVAFNSPSLTSRAPSPPS